jgi:predicted aldo/keto reductase-like oxidoreductase
MFDAPDVAAVNYNIIMGGMLSGKSGFASQCQECRACEEKCPQGIEIRKHLKKVAECFGI